MDKEKGKKKNSLGLVVTALLFWMVVGALIVESTKVEEVPAEIKVKKRELPRDEKISTQFSSFDGRHFILARTVKTQLNDPSSFQHVRTSYRDSDDLLIVLMVYRAKNSFGALIKTSVVAQISLEGTILYIN